MRSVVHVADPCSRKLAHTQGERHTLDPSRVGPELILQLLGNLKSVRASSCWRVLGRLETA